MYILDKRFYLFVMQAAAGFEERNRAAETRGAGMTKTAGIPIRKRGSGVTRTPTVETGIRILAPDRGVP